MATHLHPAAMKQFVLDHFEDFVNRRKPEVIQRNMTENFLDHDGPGGKPTGVAGDEAMMRAMHRTLPDLRLEVLDCIAAEDKVACRNIWRWTDAASGKPMQFHGFVLWRFEGDKIAERWATVTPPVEGSAWSSAEEGVANSGARQKNLRVALYGATGRAGSRILRELARRGHQVTAIAREARSNAASEDIVWKTDDLSEVSRITEVIRGADVVVSAYAPPAGDTDALIGACERLAGAVRAASVPRLLVVGGAGVLEVAPNVTLLQSGKLPPEWLPIAASHAKALAALEQTTINWTYLSPAAYFDPGERTGHYRASQNTLLTDANGESRISMEDYAIAVVDELEHPKHLRARFAVAW